MTDWSPVVTKSHTNRRLMLAVLLETMNAGVSAVFWPRRDIQGGGFMRGNLSSDRVLNVLAQLRKMGRAWWASLAPEGLAWAPAEIRQTCT